MKVFLRKDIERVGFAGEIVNVKEGYARNFLFPRGFAVELNAGNESFYQSKLRKVEHRKEALETQTSMLAEKIKALKLVIKRKMHDDGKLYGAISPTEIVEILSQKGISISKSQVKIVKSIKTKGSHKVTIKLTSRLLPELRLEVVPE